MQHSLSAPRFMALFVWMTGSIFYAYQYVLRVMPSIMMQDIMHQFNIDATVFGQFSGVYYIGYSLMHLPLGIMLDRYGPRSVMTGCILLTVAGLTPILFAEHWLYPIIGRCLIGMGSSAAILGTFKIIRMTFNQERFTRMLSLSVTIGLIGAIYGGAPVRQLCDTMGYQAVVQLFAGIGLVLAALTYVVVPNSTAPHTGTVLADIKTVLTNTKVLSLCLFTGLMVGPLEGFADVWGTAFLSQVYGFDTQVASYLPSTIFIGMCFGAPVLSLIAEKTGQYIGVIMGAGIFMALSFAALIFGWLTVPSMTLSFILVGVCSAYQILGIYKASTYVPEDVAGLTTAVANMIIMSFGYGFHAVIGAIITLCGGPTTRQAFIYGVSIIPLTLIIGVAGFLYLFFSERNSLQSAPNKLV